MSRIASALAGAAVGRVGTRLANI